MDQPTGRVPQFLQRFLTIPIVLAVAISATASVIWWTRFRSPNEQTIQLANASFEEVTAVSFLPTDSGWYGDAASVVRHVSGVAPYHGEAMLQFMRSTLEPEQTCEVYQIVDLQNIGIGKRKTPRFIEVSALINSLDNDSSSPSVFSLCLYSLAVNPFEQGSPLPTTWGEAVSFAGNQVTADLDRQTWQRIHSVMPYDHAAKFLLIQIAVRGESPGGDQVSPGQFVDHVTMKLKNSAH